MRIPFLIGRIIYGGFFVYNGINHLRNREAMAQYAASKQVPMPEASVVASGLALIAGGTSVIAGAQPKLGLTAILGFLSVVTPTMHDFWRQEDPGERMNNMIHFSKNMALLGAALALMEVEEPWPNSIGA